MNAKGDDGRIEAVVSVSRVTVAPGEVYRIDLTYKVLVDGPLRFPQHYHQPLAILYLQTPAGKKLVLSAKRRFSQGVPGFGACGLQAADTSSERARRRHSRVATFDGRSVAGVVGPGHARAGSPQFFARRAFIKRGSGLRYRRSKERRRMHGTAPSRRSESDFECGRSRFLIGERSRRPSNSLISTHT